MGESLGGLPELSNFYSLPGRAGGLPNVIIYFYGYGYFYRYHFYLHLQVRFFQFQFQVQAKV